jgi:hypothetical protein
VVHRFWLLFGSLLLLGVAYAGDSLRHEAVIKELLASVDKIAEVLGTVKDEESAKSAVPVLRKRAKEWDVIRKKAEAQPPPSAEERDKLTKKLLPDVEATRKKLFAQVGRVKQLPGGRIALQEISAVLQGQKLKDKKD